MPDLAFRGGGEAIAEALFRNMLPRSETDFIQELQVWHPGLHPGRYLAEQSFPRCWIVTAAITVAIAHTEYARYLLESMRDGSSLLSDRDLRVAELSGPELSALLDAGPWRKAICRIGSRMYFFGPQTLTRAFALGLNFAFAQPDAARSFVRVVQSSDRTLFDQMLAGAVFVINRNPVSVRSLNRP
jgi:hypothetical protein